MKEGVLPPETSNVDLNQHYDMIDAQLTTEIFGLIISNKRRYRFKNVLFTN